MTDLVTMFKNDILKYLSELSDSSEITLSLERPTERSQFEAPNWSADIGGYVLEAKGDSPYSVIAHPVEEFQWDWAGVFNGDAYLAAGNTCEASSFAGIAFNRLAELSQENFLSSKYKVGVEQSDEDYSKILFDKAEASIPKMCVLEITVEGDNELSCNVYDQRPPWPLEKPGDNQMHLFCKKYTAAARIEDAIRKFNSYKSGETFDVALYVGLQDVSPTMTCIGSLEDCLGQFFGNGGNHKQ